MSSGGILNQKVEIPDNPATIASNVSYNNSSTSSIITGKNVQQAIDQLFTSVSNGKKKIAGAITDKGVSTSANDSFDTMANNIKNIQTKTFFDDLNVLNTSENSYLYDIEYRSTSHQWPVFSSNCPLSYTPFIAIGQIIQSSDRDDNTISMYKVENKSVQKMIDFNIINKSVKQSMYISFSVDGKNLVATINHRDSFNYFEERYIFVPDLSKSVNYKTKATYVASKNQQDPFDFKFEISNFSPTNTDFIKINKVNKWEAIELYDKEQLFTYRNVYVNNLIMKNGAIEQITNYNGAPYPFFSSNGNNWADAHQGFYLDDNGFHLLIDNSSYGKNYGVKFNIDLDIEVYTRPGI